MRGKKSQQEENGQRESEKGDQKTTEGGYWPSHGTILPDARNDSVMAVSDHPRVSGRCRAIERTIVDINAAPLAKDKLKLEFFLDGESGTITLDGSSKPAPPQAPNALNR